MSKFIKKLFGTLSDKPWEKEQMESDNHHQGKTFDISLQTSAVIVIFGVSTVLFTLVVTGYLYSIPATQDTDYLLKPNLLWLHTLVLLYVAYFFNKITNDLKKNNFIQSGGYGVVNNKDNIKNLHTEFAVFKKADDKFKYKRKTICLKIDVEGHEIFVLDGLKNIFKNNKIFLQIEILPNNFIKTNKWLSNFGFKKINKINADYYFYKETA